MDAAICLACHRARDILQLWDQKSRQKRISRIPPHLHEFSGLARLLKPCYNGIEMMISPKYYLLFLSALFLCLVMAAAGAPSWEAESAKTVASKKAAPISIQEDDASFLSLPVSRGLSPGQRQLDGRLSKGKFLVAGRHIRDPRFRETVIILIQHDLNGSIGLIVNRPTTVKLSDFFPEIKEQPGKEHFTYIGGPVEMAKVHLLMHGQNKPEGAQRIFDDVYASTSKTVFDTLIKNPEGEVKFRAYAGYAGWGYGQLEQEIFRGDWQVVRADAETIFKKPSSQIWPDLIRESETIRIEI